MPSFRTVLSFCPPAPSICVLIASEYSSHSSSILLKSSHSETTRSVITSLSFLTLVHQFKKVTHRSIVDKKCPCQKKAWEHRLKFGLILKKTHGRLLVKKKSLKSETKKSYTGLSLWKCFMNNIYIKYIFYVTCLTLNLLENQSHKSKQVVFQIWGWYLKKLALSKILFGCSTKFSPLDASKTLLVHSVWICDLQ